MPINVDTVYQTVQALLNKEQRGYLTPQEFNLFANQAQQDIFEQYLYDLNAFRKAGPELQELGDSIDHLRSKIAPWTSIQPIVNNQLCQTCHAVGKIFLGQGTANRRELTEMSVDQIKDLRASRWHKAGFTEATFFKDGWRRIQVWDGNGPITANLSHEVMDGEPGLVFWGYVVVNQKPLYDPSSSRHFELDISERPDLVIKILKLAGISIEDPAIYQAAGQEEQLNMQQESK